MYVVDLCKGSFVDDKRVGFGTCVSPCGFEYEGRTTSAMERAR